MVTTNEIRSFVNDGDLVKVVTDRKYSIVPLVKFVHFNSSTGVLKLLLGGRNPITDTLSVSNINNYYCCKDVLLPIYKERFPLITDVIPTITHKDIFEGIIESCGFRLRSISPDTCEEVRALSIAFNFFQSNILILFHRHYVKSTRHTIHNFHWLSTILNR